MDTDTHGSLLRKQLYDARQKMAKLISPITGRGSMIKGAVYKLRRKCGKQGCRCTKGHLHESWVLAVPHEGRKLIRTVPKGKRTEWKRLTDRYRRFRQARAQLVRLFARLLELVDQIEELRTTPPPE